MAFASYDAIISALANGLGQEAFFAKSCSGLTLVAGKVTSLWTGTGMPAAGVSGGTALTARAVDATTAGALAFKNPAADLYMTGWNVTPNFANGGILLLYDRVHDIATIDCTSTSTQTITMTDFNTTPGRYGATGAGLQMFLEVTTGITGGTNPTVAVTYTDQDGNTAATSQIVTAASSIAQIPHTNSPFLPLAAGDYGIRDIQSIKFEAGGGIHSAGVATLVLARPLAQIPVPGAANNMNERDMVLQIPKLPEIEDSAALAFLYIPTTTTTGVFFGSVQAAEG